MRGATIRSTARTPVSTGRKIDFKTPLEILVWLDAALKHEKLKYDKAPVGQDVMPDYEMAQGWGYVVAGYSLLEQSLKALLHVRGKHVPMKHSLTILFDLLEPCDRDILREYYIDYRETASGMDAFPFGTLDSFLENLDGDKNTQGTDRIGSFDWRYSPIERAQSQSMPTVSVDYLHEIIYGCIQMVQAADTGKTDPSRSTNSWRMHRQRELNRYRHWNTLRMNSEGWDQLGDRLEILWGPDYRDRYDWQIFVGASRESRFCKLPKHSQVPVVDKRTELVGFDAEAAMRRTGMIWQPRKAG